MRLFTQSARFAVCVAVAAVFNTVLGWGAEQDDPREPLRVPAGNKLLFLADAGGDQIYRVQQNPDGTYRWVLSGPDAELYEGPILFGHHGPGATWTAAVDGSSITGQVLAARSSNLSGSVDWLLLKVVVSTGGKMGDVRYVVRALTEGGQPPSDPPRGDEPLLRVHYSARYYFYGVKTSEQRIAAPSGSLLGRTTLPSGKAVFGFASSPNGYAFGGQFESNSTDGIGVLGIANATTGATYGGNFQSLSVGGTGVYGVGRSTTGLNYGVYGQSDSDNGVGVSGITFAKTGPTIGVLGTATSPQGFGVFSRGPMATDSTLGVRMDDPLHPDEKYLMHYATVAPDPMDEYSGTTTTDDNGEAWVALPAYFDRINRDFRYQLTVVDDTDSTTFVQAKIAKPIAANRFKIRTSAPRVKVCWDVKAVRTDSFMRQHPVPAELPKVTPVVRIGS